jgi:hypothetical protein
MDTLLTLQELFIDSFFPESDALLLKYRCGGGQFFAFWGEAGEPNLNIAMLRKLELPVCIELNDSEFCVPSAREKKKYNLAWSVPSHASIHIHSEF